MTKAGPSGLYKLCVETEGDESISPQIGELIFYSYDTTTDTDPEKVVIASITGAAPFLLEFDE